MPLVRTSLAWEHGPSGTASRGLEAHRVPGRRRTDTSRKIPVRPPQRCLAAVRATSTVGLAFGPPGGRRAASTLDRATPLVCHTGQGPGQSSRREYPERDVGQTRVPATHGVLRRNGALPPPRTTGLPDGRSPTRPAPAVARRPRNRTAYATRPPGSRTTSRTGPHLRRHGHPAPPDPHGKGARTTEVVRAPSGARAGATRSNQQDYLLILVTWPAPTVRPPSRMANFRPSSMATGWMSSTFISVLSPGMTISVPSGRVTTPVTSVVRK